MCDFGYTTEYYRIKVRDDRNIGTEKEMTGEEPLAVKKKKK